MRPPQETIDQLAATELAIRHLLGHTDQEINNSIDDLYRMNAPMRIHSNPAVLPMQLSAFANAANAVLRVIRAADGASLGDPYVVSSLMAIIKVLHQQPLSEDEAGDVIGALMIDNPTNTVLAIAPLLILEGVPESMTLRLVVETIQRVNNARLEEEGR